ncbi:hypothetical protein Trichorick_01640 (plasmid) [Candidatus Trichorickettsia mobilis]|uniref:hypothetical protein n=1 Tax=Candidatus Trichorickettsia mobilis TaxID=1346319 RepID=UPI002B25F051|nr:hypothetical protein [Candidatus Trichorickettsia mobilis]WPY01722.1 hypothetical protein Trichorick_01640 [Candidatus Trichorickettsia mobilis]
MKSINENYTTPQLNILKTEKTKLINKEFFSSKKVDIIDLQHRNYAKSDNIIKIFDLSNNQQTHLIYSTLENKVSANIVIKNGNVFNVHTENLPKELKQINSTEVFNKFLENVSIQVSILSDNEPKIYIRQKCYGGGGTQSTGGGSRGDRTDSSTNKTDNNKDRCIPLGLTGNILCRPNSECPDGYSKVPGGSGITVCTPEGQGVSSGDSYGGYNSKGYPVGSGSGGVYGYGVYRDDDSADSYGIKSDYTPDYSNKLYKGEYGLLGKLDAQGVTGHGYTPRTQEAHVYDHNDTLIKIPVSPKRMAVWLNDLKNNLGRFETTFYDKKCGQGLLMILI